MLNYPKHKLNFHSLCNNATMGRVKHRDAATDRENEIPEAKHAYHSGVEPSIHTAALTYSIPYGTLQDKLRGEQPRSVAHEKEQLLTPEVKKSIVRFCKALDD